MTAPCGSFCHVFDNHYLYFVNLGLGETLRYDTIVEFNVDSKAEYTAKSSTRRQKLKQNSAPLIQYRLRSVKSVRKE